MARTLQSGYFWRGPVIEISTARRIMGWAGWPFVILPALAIPGDFIDASRRGGLDTSGLIVAVLFVILGLLLIFRNSRISAIALMLLALFSGGGFIVVSSIGEMQQFEPVGFAAGALWLIAAYLEWRAFKAASAMPRLMAPPIGDTFD